MTFLLNNFKACSLLECPCTVCDVRVTTKLKIKLHLESDND